MVRLAGRYVAAAAAVLVLTASSVAALAVGAPAYRPPRAGGDASCSAPASLPGTRVTVALRDMGAMMGGPLMHGWIATSRDSVPAGRVSLVAVNQGARVHELLVLPVRPGTWAGQRLVRRDGTIAESASLGEASRGCGPGVGGGIGPGETGWVTLALAPGRYELVCNRPGHYLAGMFTELDVH